ncbi:hypothetical protein ES703_90637 [subsurface metagenome]
MGSTAAIAGTANEDGSVTAVQIAIEEVEEELEEIEEGAGVGVEGEREELRIRFINWDGVIKELIIIYQ